MAVTPKLTRDAIKEAIKKLGLAEKARRAKLIESAKKGK